MAGFLDNSGDIILDAVLTDIGRQRLARADGSFRITAFALGDDEINYALYDSSLATARKDLNVLKTPVLEAFTDSSSAVRHRLLTLRGLDNTLFLPVAKLNTKSTTNQPFPGFPFAASADNGSTSNQFVVLANQLAVDKYVGSSNDGDGQLPNGFINGVSTQTAAGSRIVVDQGLDTNQLSFKRLLEQELNEDTYIVQVDDRILKIASPRGTQAVESFIDTDRIATYVISAAQYYRRGASGEAAQQNQSPIAGPRGNTFTISFAAASQVAASDFLYDQLGSEKTNYFPAQKSSGNRDAKVIDTVVRLTGNKTGITLNIPVRVVKASS